MNCKVKLFVLGFAVLFLGSCRTENTLPAGIIPQPVSVEMGEGSFRLNGQTPIIADIDGIDRDLLVNAGLPGKWTDHGDPVDGAVCLAIDTEGNFGAGAYWLVIGRHSAEITAGDIAGLFYGLQSLRQLYDLNSGKIPCMTVVDEPRMEYRSLLLDVSSHYFTVGFVKRQIDMMARLKMNRLILLVASEGGWRLEIPAYPQLTDQGAWRTIESYSQWRRSGKGFCSEDTPGAYGGYYTPDDISEILLYAAERFIEVIPALDIPCAHGNVAALLDGLECFTGSRGRETEIEAMETILAEVIRVFHSGSVYLGDGHASDPQSISCLECQPKVEKGKTGYINDSRHGYIIPHMEDFLESQGVRLMLWEESIRGVVSDNTALVAWHDPAEAVTVAEMGYEVTVAPTRYSSLDFYQTDPHLEPASSMGFLPLEAVYSFEPLPRTLERQYASHLSGFQGNLWTYYIGDESQAETKLYPRLFAVAELGWTIPERKSYPDFRKRARGMLEVLGKDGYGYFDLDKEVAVRDESVQPAVHLARGKTAEYKTPFNRTYPGSGEPTLTDGIRGGWALDDGRWQGFFNNDMDVVVDLGSVMTFRSVTADFVRHIGAGIWLPERVEIAVSDDGQTYRTLATVDNDRPSDDETFLLKPFGWKGSASGRYIRYTAHRPDKAGAWMFTDEIMID